MRVKPESLLKLTIYPPLFRTRHSGTVAFTNGCFDLFHAGHVRLLEFASRHADFLVVGLNADASVARLKGPGRPHAPFRERSLIISQLPYVDAIYAFAEDTPERLIRELRPDVLVKGSDHDPSTVVGREFVESYGGRFVACPRDPGEPSTTEIVRKIREAL